MNPTASSFALALSLAACGGITEARSGPSGSTSGTSVASCPTVSASELLRNGLGGGQSVLEGKVTGSTLSCTICGVGAVMTVLDNGTGPTLNFAPAVTDAGLSVGGNCTTPSNVSPGSLSVNGQMAIAKPAPGVYTMVGAADWDPMLVISYWVPNPNAIDCGDAAAPACAPGCSSSCGINGDGGEFCSPCEPEGAGAAVLTTQYIAEPASDNGIPRAGSWTVTLTSVTPYAGDAGVEGASAQYVVHGTVTADLPSSDSPSANNVAASFSF